MHFVINISGGMEGYRIRVAGWEGWEEGWGEGGLVKGEGDFFPPLDTG